MSLLIEKNDRGCFVISDIIKGYLVSKVYYGYNKKESIKLFKEDVNKILKGVVEHENNNYTRALKVLRRLGVKDE